MGRIYYRIVVLEIHYLALGVHTKLATEFTLISSDKQQTNYKWLLTHYSCSYKQYNLFGRYRLVSGSNIRSLYRKS